MSAPNQNGQAQKLPNAAAAMSVQQLQQQQQHFLRAQQQAFQQALANGPTMNSQQYAMLMQGQLPVAAAGGVNQRPASQQGVAVAPGQKVTIEQKEWGEFFNEFPQLRAAFNQQTSNGNEQQKQQIIAKFTAWKVAKQKRQAEQLNKLRHQPSTSSAASVPQPKPVGALQPQPQPAAPVNPAAMLEHTATAAADLLRERAAREQAEALKKLENRFPFISRPVTGEDRSFLPRQRLKVLSKKACADLGVGKLSTEAEKGMKSLAADFSKGAISFAIGAARRKRSQKLDPADVALYLKQTYDIDIPSLKGAEVAPYKRLVADEVHKARLAAVRRGNIAQTREKGAAERTNKPSGAGRKVASVPGPKRTPAAAAVGEEEDMALEERPPGAKKARTSKAAKANGKPAAAAVEEEDMPDIM